MPTPQSGIFTLGTTAHAYLEFTRRARITPKALARAVVGLWERQATSGSVNLVVGFRPSLWEHLAPAHAPARVADFEQDLQGADGYSMPATQRDLWLWIAGHAHDTVFDASRAAIAALGPSASLTDLTAGWSYRNNRDLTGFIDGTTNPPLALAPAVVTVPEGSRGAGCSVVLVQKWVHDGAAWESLTVAEQERIIGRTKIDSIALDAAMLGPQSHVTRTTIEKDGRGLAVFRRDMPFGTAAVYGMMFVGFSQAQQRLTHMLARMTGAEDGIRDALTYYATVLSGAYYVTPSVEALHEFATAAD
jgi:putative iron-dependent peroxidase